MDKATLVVGASTNPERYSHKAILNLLEKGHTVFGIGIKEGSVANVPIYTNQPKFDSIHTVTLYIKPILQREYYKYILNLKPKRIIFNPGTENNELIEMATKNNIEVLKACTLVLLSIGTY